MGNGLLQGILQCPSPKPTREIHSLPMPSMRSSARLLRRPPAQFNPLSRCGHRCPFRNGQCRGGCCCSIAALYLPAWSCGASHDPLADGEALWHEGGEPPPLACAPCWVPEEGACGVAKGGRGGLEAEPPQPPPQPRREKQGRPQLQQLQQQGAREHQEPVWSANCSAWLDSTDFDDTEVSSWVRGTHIALNAHRHVC